ncbi:MAG TPA: DUF1015 family protein [Candidatus Polarisedimenticolaceae bacterium]|nr:DUF1015 family protein [Candidatus Polarisedimenticolaceae bacterium]
MIVEPFRGLRPRADLAEKIPSLPYDVLDSTEARAVAHGDPYSFLHVVKAEIDLDPSIDPHDERVYAKARENFVEMRSKGWLIRDPRPSYYLYQQRMGEHVQTGIVGAAAIADYREGRIKRHEHTRADKEDDRTRLTQEIGAQPGTVFLTYRDEPAIDGLTADEMRRPATVDYLAKDGVTHALWIVDDPERVARFHDAFREIPASYIADGHHRAAAYARAARTTGFLAAHFPASSLRILDYNRLVRDLGGLAPADLFRRLAASGCELVDPWPTRRPPRPGTFAIYLEHRWRLATLPPGPPGDPVAALDVSRLQDVVLGPILGVGDPRSDPRISFVGGIRGMEELERSVDSGRHALAIAMYPTSLRDVMRVADTGGVMPPKSTWFEPKLRSGMVIRLLDGED